MKVGIIGIGKMGHPMALRLAVEGHEVIAYDAAPGAAAGLEGVSEGALADVAACPAIITMLPNGGIVRSVANQIAPMMAEGSVLIDMSSSYPFETLDLRKALPDAIRLIDAPVSGGVWRAEIGTLTIIAGGDAADLDLVTPMLEAMGKVTRTGALGSGHAMKLLNNYLSAAGLAAACEAVTVGKAFGLDPDVMADVFNGSTGKNNATEVKLKQHVNSEAYGTGFSMGLMAKDLALGARLTGDLGLEADGLMAMKDLFAKGVEAFGGDADHTEIAKLLK
ncbi:MAG: NAD(P)-dependent oxidoreductase [Paracoccaceae bacterium]|nr:NAD(P)-dependent oxidoreductase [Paracoccaceae bacterium]MDG1371065.1 NAD(P)-dependent oxidoreductase [Paracoccaceae bacterium]